MFDASFALKVFAALFAIMNPIANIPVFLSLTEGADDTAKRRIAMVALFGVSVGCVVSLVAGAAILRLFGITITDFRLAGGLLVLLIALDMLHGSASAQHQPGAREMPGAAAVQDVAVYPLTVPLLVGPGTIATLIVFGHTAAAQGRIASLAAGLVAFLALLGASLYAAPAIGHHLSARVTAITKRLMGMVLAAIAMEMMLASLQVFLKGVLG